MDADALSVRDRATNTPSNCHAREPHLSLWAPLALLPPAATPPPTATTIRCALPFAQRKKEGASDSPPSLIATECLPRRTSVRLPAAPAHTSPCRPSSRCHTNTRQTVGATARRTASPAQPRPEDQRGDPDEEEHHGTGKGGTEKGRPIGRRTWPPRLANGGE